MQTILLVDDELSIRKSYGAIFRGEGYCVVTARDGTEALRSLGENRPDLVLLDVDMPKMNGFSCCTQIRRLYPQLPVVFLTANAQESNEVRAFGAGADDFIAKDAPLNVLLVRVSRVLERAAGVCPERPLRKLDFGAVSVDLARLTVSERGRVRETLTATESGLLALLASKPAEVFSNEEIVAALRGEGFACEAGLLYPHISRLRHKLGEAGERLVSYRGVGYSLACG